MFDIVKSLIYYCQKTGIEGTYLFNFSSLASFPFELELTKDVGSKNPLLKAEICIN